MPRTIRWGIIGCGNVTEVKSGPALQLARNSALVAVMRRDGEKARDYAARHGVPRWYDDAASLTNDPEADAVYITTPPSSHMPYARQVAAAGKPVYVEKPMGCTYDECQAMLDACETAGVPLFVAYYRRALPRFRKVKELIADGAIGEVRFVNARLYVAPDAGDYDRENLPWRVRPEIAGGGKFLDLGSHALDLFDHLLGPIAEVQGQAANLAGLYPVEDTVTAGFTFASGALGSAVWCFNAYNARSVDITEIIGSKGMIRYGCFAEIPVELHTMQGVETFAIENPAHIQQPLIQMLVDELNGSGRCPSTGKSAARTNRVMDAVLQRWRVGHVC